MTRPPAIAAAGVAPIPTTRLGRALVRLRVRVFRRRLDRALADGADPWSSAPLLWRAEYLASSAYRMRVANALDALVDLAERRRPVSPYLQVRADAVLDHRYELGAMAQRLRGPAPVDVAVVARLAQLTWDELSPVFAGGRPPATLGTTLELCATSLVD